MSATIRLATVADAAEVLAIYTPYITDSVISFEYTPPTVADMQGRIARALSQWTWLICEYNDRMAGYAYASQHSDRTAYNWSVNVSAYLRPEFHRRGIGRALYTSLFALLRLQGFYQAYAGVTLPNPASVGLHEAMGFKPVGIYQQVGYKFGKWYDVGWWQMNLQPLPDAPPTLTVPLATGPEWDTALETGIKLLR